MEMKILLFVIVAFIHGIATAQVSATYSDRLADISGAYLVAADVNEKVNASKCGRYIKKPNPLTLKQAVIDVRSRVPSDVAAEFERFLSSTKFQLDMAENSDFIRTILDGLKRDGSEFGYACGLLVGITTAQNRPVLEAWKRLR
jgi:hypothetical protein